MSIRAAVWQPQRGTVPGTKPGRWRLHRSSTYDSDYVSCTRRFSATVRGPGLGRGADGRLGRWWLYNHRWRIRVASRSSPERKMVGAQEFGNAPAETSFRGLRSLSKTAPMRLVRRMREAAPVGLESPHLGHGRVHGRAAQDPGRFGTRHGERVRPGSGNSRGIASKTCPSASGARPATGPGPDAAPTTVVSRARGRGLQTTRGV